VDDLPGALEREAAEIATLVAAAIRERHPHMFERYGRTGATAARKTPSTT